MKLVHLFAKIITIAILNSESASRCHLQALWNISNFS